MCKCKASFINGVLHWLLSIDLMLQKLFHMITRIKEIDWQCTGEFTTLPNIYERAFRHISLEKTHTSITFKDNILEIASVSNYKNTAEKNEDFHLGFPQ